MKTNEALQKDVQQALEREAQLQGARIGTSAEDGIVTLRGIVDSDAKKGAAVQAAKAVAGVRGIVDGIRVHPGEGYVADGAIAADASRMLRESLVLRQDAVTVIVEHGWITLEGILDWQYQREIACHLVKDLPGVAGVINKIQLERELPVPVEKEGLLQALRSHRSIDADEIEVSVQGSAITLEGYVYSLYQKQEVEKPAYTTPGVTTVINNLKVERELPYLC